MNYKEAVHLVITDFKRWNPKVDKLSIGAILVFIRSLILNKSYKFIFWWRLAKVNSPFTIFLRLISRHYSTKYGIEIPLSVTIGESFLIGHAVSIVLNGNCTIGNNVTICQCLTIGSTVGVAATIGNNVYIGPNVCIVDDVIIGDNVIIGAGAVVTKNIPNNQVWAGNPARFIKDNISNNEN